MALMGTNSSDDVSWMKVVIDGKPVKLPDSLLVGTLKHKRKLGGHLQCLCCSDGFFSDFFRTKQSGHWVFRVLPLDGSSMGNFFGPSHIAPKVFALALFVKVGGQSFIRGSFTDVKCTPEIENEENMNLVFSKRNKQTDFLQLIEVFLGKIQAFVRRVAEHPAFFDSPLLSFDINSELLKKSELVCLRNNEFNMWKNENGTILTLTIVVSLDHNAFIVYDRRNEVKTNNPDSFYESFFGASTHIRPAAFAPAVTAEVPSTVAERKKLLKRVESLVHNKRWVTLTESLRFLSLSVNAGSLDSTHQEWVEVGVVSCVFQALEAACEIDRKLSVRHDISSLCFEMLEDIARSSRDCAVLVAVKVIQLCQAHKNIAMFLEFLPRVLGILPVAKAFVDYGGISTLMMLISTPPAIFRVVAGSVTDTAASSSASASEKNVLEADTLSRDVESSRSVSSHSARSVTDLTFRLSSSRSVPLSHRGGNDTRRRGTGGREKSGGDDFSAIFVAPNDYDAPPMTTQRSFSVRTPLRQPSGDSLATILSVKSHSFGIGRIGPLDLPLGLAQGPRAHSMLEGNTTTTTTNTS